MRYAREAPSLVMREIAKIADSKGYTQESLANAWPTSGVRGRNIMEHFNRLKPREDTIRQYAAVLEIPDEYLLLVNGSAVNEARWLTIIGMEFETEEWVRGTDVAVREALEELPDGERRKILRTFALSWLRAEIDGEVHGGYIARGELEKCAMLRGVIGSRRRKWREHERCFLDLWSALGETLTPRQFDKVLALIRDCHKRNGIDSAAMNAALDDEPAYQKWRKKREWRSA